MVPSFFNPAQYGQVKFWGLHERREEFSQTLMRFEPLLPECAKGYYNHASVMNLLDQMCGMGMFVANHPILVIAMAFFVYAHKYIAMAHPENTQKLPESQPFWDCSNSTCRAISEMIAPILGSEYSPVFFKLQNARLMFKV